jgi:hypothetical protein
LCQKMLTVKSYRKMSELSSPLITLAVLDQTQMLPAPKLP